MPQSKQHRVFIVAGEESGDRHAAEMVQQLKKKQATLQFSGVGGQHMQNAGVKLISDLARFGVTGTIEVLRHVKVIRRAYKAIKAHLLAEKPDLLILVDYPGFNLRLARFAKKHHIRVLYYISPQIWAWKAGRIKTIRHCVEKMAVIFPFEKKIYEDAGVPVAFVGHPLVKHVTTCQDKPFTRQALGLPAQCRLIALLPGSRTSEIEYHMPVLVETAKRLLSEHQNLHFVIPVAQTIHPDTIAAHFQQENLPITLIQGRSIEGASCSDCIIVSSGTASLECALLEIPMCIIYKGAWFSCLLVFLLVKVQYFGLCNILENRMIVPELLQYDCTADELTKTVNQLLSHSSTSESITKRLQRMKYSLSEERADIRISDLVLETLSDQ